MASNRLFLTTAAILWLGAWQGAGVSLAQAAEVNKSAAANSNGIEKRDRFQDWEVLCGKQGRTDGKTQSVCTVAQAVNEKDSKKLFMTAEIAVDVNDEQGLLLNIAPVGIDFMQGVKLVVGKQSYALQLRTCYPQGCIATTPMAAVGGADGLASASEITVQFKTITGDAFQVPLSSKGLKEALQKADSMAKA